jgi:hypothetical protein
MWFHANSSILQSNETHGGKMVRKLKYEPCSIKFGLTVNEVCHFSFLSPNIVFISWIDSIQYPPMDYPPMDECPKGAPYGNSHLPRKTSSTKNGRLYCVFY